MIDLIFYDRYEKQILKQTNSLEKDKPHFNRFIFQIKQLIFK